MRRKRKTREPNLRDNSKPARKRSEFANLCTKAIDRIEDAKDRGDQIAMRKWASKLADYSARRDEAQLIIDSRGGYSRHKLARSRDMKDKIESIRTFGR